MSKSLKLIIESLLFSSDKPLTVGEIQSCLPDANNADIKSAIKVLQHEYESMARSFTLKEVAKGFQFRSRSEYGAYILRLLQTSPNRLSKATMETLAIVAYKQPILRHEVELLRGVDVGGILRTLLEKGLIRIVGRKDLPGKPLIYGTTKNFLEVFDLKDIKSLPKLKEIKAFGIDDYEPTPIDEAKETVRESENNLPDDAQEWNAGQEDTATEAATDQETGGETSETDPGKDIGNESQGQQEQNQDEGSSESEEDREQSEETVNQAELSREKSGTGIEQETEQDSDQEDTGTEINSDGPQEFSEEHAYQEQVQESRAAGQDREPGEEEDNNEIIDEPSREDLEAGDEQGFSQEDQDKSEENSKKFSQQTEDTGPRKTEAGREQDTDISGDDPGRETAD